jgi:arginine decarboxylase
MFGIFADSILVAADEGTTLKIDLDLERWSVADAAELYEVARWGNGYFSVNLDGHVCVHPTKDPERSIDLKQLVDRLQLRGIDLPILIRFADILKHRLGEIHAVFQTAMTEQKYQGNYCCVYPIKVNQQRHVVEEIVQFGGKHGVGLECGSKPELQAVLGLSESTEHLIVCNGYKDEEFMRLALMGQKLGHTVYVVMEQLSELETLLKVGKGFLAKDGTPTVNASSFTLVDSKKEFVNEPQTP